MSTPSLSYLEERLNSDAPALKWRCEPVAPVRCIAGTTLPAEIQIHASKEGVPVKGTPFFLSGECLLRWGVAASANLICNEVRPSIQGRRHRAGLDWDRLSDV